MVEAGAEGALLEAKYLLRRRDMLDPSNRHRSSTRYRNSSENAVDSRERGGGRMKIAEMNGTESVLFSFFLEQGGGKAVLREGRAQTDQDDNMSLLRGAVGSLLLRPPPR